MSSYYTQRLSAKRLQQCYEIAPPRVKQYLDAEINFVIEKIRPDDLVLELGCGYGRVMSALVQKARWVIGIDVSVESLRYGQTFLQGTQNCILIPMDAAHLAFLDSTFDMVVCIQNGISAFKVDQSLLFRESVRVTKQGGIILFSSYSDKFWDSRLEWFRLQSKAGLVGEIDNVKTTDGVIVCKDGFTSSTVSPDGFLALARNLNIAATIQEVDESSLFCQMIVKK